MAQYTITIKDLLEQGVKMFDFNYNFYSYNAKSEFEEKFIQRYLFREIGFYTFEVFEHHLRAELNDMYVEMKHLYDTTMYEYDAVNNYNVTETIDTTNSNNNKYHDTPITILEDYKERPSSVSDSTGSGNTTRTMKGNIGVMTTQDLIQKERETIINLDAIILDRLNKLFMGVF